MRFIEKYGYNLFFRVDKPEEVILEYLNKTVPYQKTGENTIQIAIKPTFLKPSEGRGHIRLIFQKKGGHIEKIKAEIIPTSLTKESFYIFLSILSIWTTAAFIISLSFYSTVTVIVGWIIFFVVIHLIQQLNQGKLENYVNALIAEIIKLKVSEIEK